MLSRSHNKIKVIINLFLNLGRLMQSHASHKLLVIFIMSVKKNLINSNDLTNVFPLVQLIISKTH